MAGASLSFPRREAKRSPRSGGGTIVAARAEFDLQSFEIGTTTVAPIDDAEIEAVNQTAVAALLTEIAHVRACPFAIANNRISDAPALGHGISSLLFDGQVCIAPLRGGG
jgi:hypothetical protein